MVRDVKDGFETAGAEAAAEEGAREEERQRPAGAPPEDVERLRAALADLEDAKLRLRRDNERQTEILRSRVLQDLLPVVDDLERTVAAAESSKSVDAIVSGVKMVLGQFYAVLERFGLQRVSAAGKRFDPRFHDAIAVVPVVDPKLDGMVITEIEPAYVMGDRVVRPAKVQVGRAAARPQA